jgi:hypothetical protein
VIRADGGVVSEQRAGSNSSVLPILGHGQNINSKKSGSQPFSVRIREPFFIRITPPFSLQDFHLNQPGQTVSLLLPLDTNPSKITISSSVKV